MLKLGFGFTLSVGLSPEIIALVMEDAKPGDGAAELATLLNDQLAPLGFTPITQDEAQAMLDAATAPDGTVAKDFNLGIIIGVPTATIAKVTDGTKPSPIQSAVMVNQLELEITSTMTDAPIRRWVEESKSLMGLFKSMLIARVMERSKAKPPSREEALRDEAQAILRALGQQRNR